MLAGNYAAVIKQARGEIRDAPGNTEWSMLLIRALLATGKNGDADVALKEAMTRDPRSIRLRWLARDVAFANGRPEEVLAHPLVIEAYLGVDATVIERSAPTLSD